ncbi:uncharacterized protein LOC128546157 isoform X2 [Mercenaria mercenaria]|uniref:uncharacterized protein LOC128546157 isoform X2 n=1 Tax=Mercenaria mercenaria TaxID=6596 RepID=UPI00234F2872|nr:uncharacterized protein LOC128546157 isoform X2 [Mercenaria mercenaria]
MNVISPYAVTPFSSNVYQINLLINRTYFIENWMKTHTHLYDNFNLHYFVTIVEDSKAGHLLMKPRPESITSMETDSVKKRKGGSGIFLNQIQNPVTVAVSRQYKDFDELQDQVRRLKKRVRELEKFQDSEKSSNKASNLPEGPILSSHSESPSSPSQKPCEEYNGYTEPQLKDMICHEDSLFECCKKLLALFSTDYITTHSVTGRRANTSTEPKPKFDPRLYACLSKVLKEKFPGTKDTEITLKVRAVQKKCKKANQ